MSQRFVVRSHPKEGQPCKKMDFHLVDLDENYMIEEYIPSITSGVGNGVMVNYFDNIYVLGGMFGFKDENNKLEDHHFHLGASRYSAVNSNWKSIDLPQNSSATNAAVISGKMYCFGSLYLQLEILDFDGTWKKLELPSELQGHVLSDPLVTDDEKSRIIVHVCDLSQLYAFCPPKEYLSRGGSTGGTWSMIATDFNIWCNVVGVTDDLICFHEWHYENLLRVFDLRSNTWLQVVADLSNVEIIVREFDRLFTFPMGEGFMCLVSSLPVRPVAMQDPPSVHFLRFCLKRSPDLPSVVNLKALDYQYYHIPSAGSVSDFVLLQYS